MRILRAFGFVLILLSLLPAAASARTYYANAWWAHPGLIKAAVNLDRALGGAKMRPPR